MDPQGFVAELKNTKRAFDRSTECLGEEDSTFAPSPGTLTVAQQVAHVAQTVDWFLEGAFRSEGFDLDFTSHLEQLRPVTSLAEARAWLDRAFSQVVEKIASLSAEELNQPMAEGPVMGGAPRSTIIGALVDHTAHHRGALTVYSRLRGHEPAMPYM